MSDYTGKTESLLFLGEVLNAFMSEASNKYDNEFSLLRNAIEKSSAANGWFTRENILMALDAIACVLTEDKLNNWLADYPRSPLKGDNKKKIGVIMAGNIPLVGFHDYLCVYLSGHDFVGKLSSQDKYLIPALTQIISSYGGETDQIISFTDGKLEGFDAVIATGSNNTARYFEYYFGKVPNVIRRNRSGVAILDGNESAEELSALGHDIFSYFGLGCRNVSSLLVPHDYDFTPFFEAVEQFGRYIDHNKYYNNYIYHKAIFLLNGDACLDNGFMLLKQSDTISSPVAVTNFRYYKKATETDIIIAENKMFVQCVVAKPGRDGAVCFGNAQKPELNDYADDVDTMLFLGSLRAQ